MPDLVKKDASMLPAGFGGLGAISSYHRPCAAAALTVNEAPEHYGSPAAASGAYLDFDDPFDAPVVLRSGRRADHGDTPNKAGTYDIRLSCAEARTRTPGSPPRTIRVTGVPNRITQVSLPSVDW